MRGFAELFGAILIVIIGGSLVSIMPTWLVILGGLSLTIVLGTEMAKTFRGYPIDASIADKTTGVTFEKTTTAWVQSLYDRQKPIRQNWNCRNCGGPNIEQVKCEWCGQVKE